MVKERKTYTRLKKKVVHKTFALKIEFRDAIHWKKDYWKSTSIIENFLQENLPNRFEWFLQENLPNRLEWFLQENLPSR